MNKRTAILMIDCESIGLYGDIFAVAGCLYDKETFIHSTTEPVPVHQFCFTSLQSEAKSYAAGSYLECDDRKWVEEHVTMPAIAIDVKWQHALKSYFWKEYMSILHQWDKVEVWADWIYPIETRFFSSCIELNVAERMKYAPAPFYCLGTLLAAKGLSNEYYDRPEEHHNPPHNPLADARQSAYLLWRAIRVIAEPNKNQEDTCLTTQPPTVLHKPSTILQKFMNLCVIAVTSFLSLIKRPQKTK